MNSALTAVMAVTGGFCACAFGVIELLIGVATGGKRGRTDLIIGMLAIFIGLGAIAFGIWRAL